MLTLPASGPPVPPAMPDLPEASPRPLGADGQPVPGPQQVQQTLAQKRMAQQQAQVDQVVNIMRTNVEKVIERDEKLTKLDERAEQLENGASQFEMHMGKLKKKFWQVNREWLVLLLLVVVLILTLVYFNWNSESEPADQAAAKMLVSSPEEVLETVDTAVAPDKGTLGQQTKDFLASLPRPNTTQKTATT